MTKPPSASFSTALSAGRLHYGGGRHERASCIACDIFIGETFPSRSDQVLRTSVLTCSGLDRRPTFRPVSVIDCSSKLTVPSKASHPAGEENDQDPDATCRRDRHSRWSNRL